MTTVMVRTLSDISAISWSFRYCGSRAAGAACGLPNLRTRFTVSSAGREGEGVIPRDPRAEEMPRP